MSYPENVLKAQEADARSSRQIEPSYRGDEVPAAPEGSIRDEVLRLCRSVAAVEAAKFDLHGEIENLRGRLSEILSPLAREGGGVIASPEPAYPARSDLAVELRRISAILEDLVNGILLEISELRLVRDSVAL